MISSARSYHFSAKGRASTSNDHADGLCSVRWSDPIATPSKAPWGATVRGATATGKLSRKDFGLVWNKTLETEGVAVGDEVQLTIDAELVEETKGGAEPAGR